MYAGGVSDKKSLNMLILEILSVYTDSEHRLRQEEIIRLLEVHYGMKCDRRSVKNNIVSLVQLGYPIPLKGGYCLLEHKFAPNELRTLMDGVLFSRSISKIQKGQLIQKILGMGNKYFQPKVRHIVGIEESRAVDINKLRENLDLLDDAISQKRQVSFCECHYNEDGATLTLAETPTTVNPYQILAANEHYYLIANKKGSNSITSYSIELMANITVSTEKTRPKIELPEIRLPQNLAESLVRLEGDEVNAKIKLPLNKLSILFDWFGKDIQIFDSKKDNVTVALKCKEEALFRWAMQYSDCAEVLEPSSMRKRIETIIHRMAKTYKS